MATYAVTYSEDDDWGEDLPAKRYKYRGEADAHLAHEQQIGRFARLIKRIFRLTPNQLIMQTRIAAAARLLTESDRSVSDIAYECGFYDHSAMTRAFRSATRLTPTQFRTMRKIDN